MTVKTQTLQWATHNWEDNYNLRSSPGNEWSESLIGVPSPGVLLQKDESLVCFALKVNVTYFGDSERVVEKRDSVLKECK